MFKCMGTTYHPESQDALSKVADLIKIGQDVPVKLIKEPDNIMTPELSHLVSARRPLDTYVKEALEYVHKAMAERMSKFDWVKYLVIWSKSGPGFYAGIRITLNGERPKEVKY